LHLTASAAALAEVAKVVYAIHPTSGANRIRW
jgi:hypothetical protein